MIEPQTVLPVEKTYELKKVHERDKAARGASDASDEESSEERDENNG